MTMTYKIYKLWVPAVLLSFMIGSCSSGGSTTDVNQPDNANADNAGDDTNPDNSTSDNSTDTNSTTGDATTDTNTEVVGAGPISILQGNWETDCMTDNGTIYIRQSVSVVGANITTEFASFSDAECLVPQPVGILVNGSTVQATGVTLPTGNTVNTPQGTALAVDFSFNEATVDNAPVPEEFAGLEGFSAEIIYNLVFVSAEDRLFLGDTDEPGYDGTTPQTRPISLALDFSYGRVP